MIRTRLLRLLLLLSVLVTGFWAFLFSLANNEVVALDLVLLRLPEAALSVWIVAAFIAGGLCGLVAGSVAIWRARRALTRSRSADA
ncbi:MAG TPA: LapA family protein [Pseudomonadales bacterium]|nr:LapA family protein [Pseudomonadales bacterium]